MSICYEEYNCIGKNEQSWNDTKHQKCAYDNDEFHEHNKLE